MASFGRRHSPKNEEYFDRFTERARNTLTLAQQEAQRFNHNFIGTEHILSGLLREGGTIGVETLRADQIEPFAGQQILHGRSFSQRVARNVGSFGVALYRVCVLSEAGVRLSARPMLDRAA